MSQKAAGTSRAHSLLSHLEIGCDDVYTMTTVLLQMSIKLLHLHESSVLQVFLVSTTPTCHVFVSFSCTKGKGYSYALFIVLDFGCVLNTHIFTRKHKMYKDMYTPYIEYICIYFILLVLL